MTLEASIERACVSYAKAQGWAALKTGTSGWPDRCFVLPGRVTLFIEFKTESGRLTKRQALRITHLKNLGHHAHVCTSKNQFISIVRSVVGLSVPVRP